MPQRQLDNCKNCGVELTELNRAYRLNSCRECYNKYKRRVNTANYHDHVGRVKQWHKDYHIEKTYGLTRDEINRILAIQLNGCAICKLPFDGERKIVVDHNHATGKVRDLLCHRCNIMLGHVEKDEDLVFECIEYLKRHGTEYTEQERVAPEPQTGEIPFSSNNN